MSITLILMLLTFYSCTVYTIYVTVLEEGTYTIVLQAACFVSTGVQSNVKFICFIAQRFRVREAQTFLDDTFRDYEKRGGNYRKVLLASIAITMKCSFYYIYY